MTWIRIEKIQCALCGNNQAERAIFLTIHTDGSSDLDTRSWFPILHMVKRCPNCGYCAANLSRGEPKAQEVLVQSKYQEQLEDENFPELANSYICRSMLE